MQKFIRVKNITIAYIEQNPFKKNTLFFIHGNSGSALSWRKQFSDKLLADYRLIAFDLPAHGASDGFENTDQYSLPFLGELLVAAVNELIKDENFMLAGFGLGTNIIVEMLAYNIYPKGIILLGASIIGKDFSVRIMKNDLKSFEVLTVDDCNDEELFHYIKNASVSTKTEDFNRIVSDYRQVKAPFRSLLYNNVLEDIANDQVRMIDFNAGISLLIIYGADDKIIHPGYLANAPLSIWHQTIFKIPGAGHLVHVDQPEATNLLIADYCKHNFSDPLPNQEPFRLKDADI